MTLSIEMTVGQLATENPLATRTLARYQIDFCCGGGKPLASVCEERGLDPETLLREIAADTADPEASGRRWDDAPIEDLIQHLLVAYHRPLDEEFPRIEAMARKVLRVHGAKAPEVLSGLVEVFTLLRAELEQHMAKEEQILFPMILQGQGASAGGPVSVMEHEHEEAGALLRRLRELTNDYVPPAEACNTWRALWEALAALERELHQHIHLENNVLFPRALGGEVSSPA
jgi:regulator of cell morphogenesis and NO signaling